MGEGGGGREEGGGGVSPTPIPLDETLTRYYWLLWLQAHRWGEGGGASVMPGSPLTLCHQWDLL